MLKFQGAGTQAEYMYHPLIKPNEKHLFLLDIHVYRLLYRQRSTLSMMISSFRVAQVFDKNSWDSYKTLGMCSSSSIMVGVCILLGDLYSSALILNVIIIHVFK